jgi:hypothetical protein
VTQEECLRVSPEPNEFLRAIGERPLEDVGGDGVKERPSLVGGRR